MQTKRNGLLALALIGVMLGACGGPRTQEGSSTALDGKNTTQISGVIIEQASERALSAADIAAAKARVPHQYDPQIPQNLFDFRTNLNPGANR